MIDKNGKILYEACIKTPLGSLLAIADEKKLYLLAFTDGRGLARDLTLLRKDTHSVILPGKTMPLVMIKKELNLYFRKN